MKLRGTHFQLFLLFLSVVPAIVAAPRLPYGTAEIGVHREAALSAMRFQTITQTSPQNASTYYCSAPEERVYVSLAGDVYKPAILSVATGAFVIWSSYGTPLPTGTHSITANVTANGSLPGFNATLRVMDQWAYIFTVPGTYYYYDIYYPSNKGVIIVHEKTFVGYAVLGVDMDTTTPNLLETQTKINGSTIRVNIVAIDAINLSHWKICLQYDRSMLQETELSFAPEWSHVYNPNALEIASIYTGDGVILADSYIISGTPGINATGLGLLFSVSFNIIAYGPGSLQLTGYLLDSNGYYIQYTRQNGYYTIVPEAGLIYVATYTGTPLPGETITVHNTFVNFGNSMDRVLAAQIITDFGTFQQSSGLPLNLTSFTNVTLTMPLTIPSYASPGEHQVALLADWQYLKRNQTSGALVWVDAPQLTGPGSIIISSGQPPQFPLIATITFSPTQSSVGATVRFNGQGSGGTPPYTFRWQFGDGQTSVQQNPEHTYGRPGSYTVTLQVTDGQGNVNTTTEALRITLVPKFPVSTGSVMLYISTLVSFAKNYGLLVVLFYLPTVTLASYLVIRRERRNRNSTP